MKLVRDKMPEIAVANNRPMTTRKAEPEELLRLLKQKLVEEATELAATADGSDQELEELCDVLEVINQFSMRIDVNKLVAVNLAKLEKKGGLSDLVWLEDADTQCKAV